jgi:hypothetical protein
MWFRDAEKSMGEPDMEFVAAAAQELFHRT